MPELPLQNLALFVVSTICLYGMVMLMLMLMLMLMVMVVVVVGTCLTFRSFYHYSVAVHNLLLLYLS